MQIFYARKRYFYSNTKSNSPKILHIASHSYFIPNEEEKTLLRSGIVLAGANNSNLNNSDDGYLTALEITRLNWEGLN